MVETRNRSRNPRGRVPSPTNRVTKGTAQSNRPRSSCNTMTRNALYSKRLPELKELCESYEVSGAGTKAELIKRLLNHTNNSHLGDAIVVAEVNLSGDLNMMQEIKAALIDTTNTATLFVRDIHGRTFICNEEGLGYATAKMDEPEDKYNLERAEERIQHLENRLMQDRSAKEVQWDNVRSRVISTFKRDNNAADANDTSIIDKVNKNVHNGDAISDASLYRPNGLRTDKNAYEKLYGLLPDEVNRISHIEALIYFLNIYASNLLCKSNTPLNIQRLKEKMSDFSLHFRGSNYDTSFLCKKTKKTVLYNAYNDCLVFTKNMVIKG